jgi:hypothetical protein
MQGSGELRNLNDIVVPAGVPVWPPAPGWYAVIAVIGLVLAWAAFRWWSKRRQNRYRTQALAELASMRRDPSGESLQQLPELVKRTALAAWPRTQVASLSGPDWHRFLDDSAANRVFTDGAGPLLDRLAYRSADAPGLSPAERERVLDATAYWFAHHRRPEPGG